MRFAKSLALLTGCAVLYGAAFLNPKRDPDWAGAGAVAANLGEPASAKPGARNGGAPQAQTARAAWIDPAPARAAPIAPPPAAPEAAPALTLPSATALKDDRRSPAKTSKRCGERACPAPGRFAGRARPASSVAPDAPATPVVGDRTEFLLADRV